ncbi:MULTISPECIES: hypothetical protein [Hymenobacter]|uniref:Uncharacterized protein n=1 Tax=Hymenobacter psychrotolerans DSM 18569 TaxID=1121959 RepID=A0A1M7A077_9BACT|nr:MULTISPECIES: hypothetical protein [Hymenobacter]QNE42055.1 hypothetical protein F1C16_20725 [Hymenobacter sp. NBH84]SHL36009.1 hypothetical protein SAMN02746009_02621 [Hymenobacter psychrotolerans DSM 18569]
MFHSLFPFRRLLATSFLLVFVNVFVGQCWCATVNPPQAARPAAAHHQAEKPTHPGCKGHGAVAEHHGKKGAHPAKPARSHDCCKDKSASLLSSLTSPVQKQLFLPAPALVPVTLEFYFRPAAGKWDRNRAVTLVPREHLPPKIPDIRIFIQSLTV